MARGRRRFIVWSSAALVGAMLPRPGRAAGRTQVQVALDRDRVEVGQSVTYTIKVVREADDAVPEPVLPPALAGAFEVEGPSFATQMHTSIVGGRISSRTVGSWSYVITPLRPGGRHQADHRRPPVGVIDPNLAKPRQSGEQLPPQVP